MRPVGCVLGFIFAVDFFGKMKKKTEVSSFVWLRKDEVLVAQWHAGMW